MSLAPPPAVIPSSTTLWATASKEWVIPPKPKPGRKPKKDAPTPAPAPKAPAPAPESPSASTSMTATTADTAGRRVQNRAAQRAFRERKQSQLAELQARIQQYEQGEIERNVALQQVAKRLKEENDKLREETAALKEKLAQSERERDAALQAASVAQESGAKRAREESLAEGESADPSQRKKSRTGAGGFASTASVGLSIPFFQSPPSLVSSPGSNISDDSMMSPVPDAARQQASFFPPRISLGGVFDFQSVPSVTSRPSVYDSAVSMENFDCGFCSETTPCVCRELAMASQQAPPPPPTATIEPFKTEVLDDQPQPAAPRPISILDNLPAYQPPVPLRRRAGNPGPAKTLFPVVPLGTSDCGSSRAATGAACSGDPSNCPACADDAFGKAFCTAVGEAVASQSPCADCPSRATAAAQTQVPTEGGALLCCGNPGLCGGSGACHAPSSSSSTTTTAADAAGETIPTSEAWRQLKSHPNVAFADLSLLADVVARRSKCTGPTVVIEPAPGTVTPERAVSPADAVLLSDPHAHYRQKERERSAVSASPPPSLVPHDELIACARRRGLRVVHADGVREALQMLDAKFVQT